MGYTERTTIELLGEHPKDNYVMVPKSLLLDRDLSADARLVGIYLLSLGNGWTVNQRAITTALGWPAGTHRTTKAVQQLVERGWVRHNEYRSGRRVFRHTYVMHRDRSFNADATDARANDDTAPSFNDDAASSPYKELNNSGGSVDSHPVVRESVQQDPWGGVPQGGSFSFERGAR